MGRGPRGNRNPKVKLTEDQVQMVRFEIRRGLLLREIADKFRVCTSTICNIKNRKCWSHLEDCTAEAVAVQDAAERELARMGAH